MRYLQSMNAFVSACLDGLHTGMRKQAGVVDMLRGIRIFAPSTSRTIGGVMGALPGGVSGGMTGTVVGGLGNAVLGKPREDEETGEKSNGVLARLLKGGVIGGAVGTGAGAVAGGTLGAIGGTKPLDATREALEKASPELGAALQQITTGDAYDLATTGRMPASIAALGDEAGNVADKLKALIP